MQIAIWALTLTHMIMPSAAKLCAAAGGPLVFISDQSGELYLVLTEQNGVRLPENVLNRIGVPGIVIKGKVLDTIGMRALAVEGLARR